MREQKARQLAASYSERSGETRHVVQYGSSPVHFAVLQSDQYRKESQQPGCRYVSTFHKGQEVS